jgi:hypothetical protein
MRRRSFTEYVQERRCVDWLVHHDPQMITLMVNEGLLEAGFLRRMDNMFGNPPAEPQPERPSVLRRVGGALGAMGGGAKAAFDATKDYVYWNMLAKPEDRRAKEREEKIQKAITPINTDQPEPTDPRLLQKPEFDADGKMTNISLEDIIYSDQIKSSKFSWIKDGIVKGMVRFFSMFFDTEKLREKWWQFQDEVSKRSGYETNPLVYMPVNTAHALRRDLLDGFIHNILVDTPDTLFDFLASIIKLLIGKGSLREVGWQCLNVLKTPIVLGILASPKIVLFLSAPVWAKTAAGIASWGYYIAMHIASHIRHNVKDGVLKQAADVVMAPVPDRFQNH